MIRLKAYAKINLSLQVVGKRADGYHEIDSVMQSVSLYDEISIERSDKGISIKSDDLTLPAGEGNTAYRAARLFFERTGIAPAASISIKKNIPVAAGLAGGSADAAAVLSGLNASFNAGLQPSELSVIGEQVGSDVPFCLYGGLCRCRGRGELVEKLPAVPALSEVRYIIVMPDIPISTKWVYDNFDLVWLKEGRLAGTHHLQDSISLFNDLEKVVLPKYPEVEALKKELIRGGCLQALMSGSGSAVFGLAPDNKTASRVHDRMKEAYPAAFLVESVPSGVEIL